MSLTESRNTGRGNIGGFLALVMVVGGSFFAQVFVTVNGVLTARMLGVEGRGELVLVISLAAMASQLTFGGSLPNAVSRELARLGVNARDGLGHLVRRWGPWAAVPGIVAAGYFLFVERDVLGPRVYGLAAAIVVLSVQTMSTRILIGAMLGEGTNLVKVAFTGMASSLFTTVVVATAFGLGATWNALEAAAVMMACTAVALALNVSWLARRTGGSARVEGAVLARAARRTHISSVGPIDGLALDRTLVGSLLGSVGLGLYSAATAVAGLLTILGGAIAMVILPRLVRVQGDPDAERTMVRTTIAFSAAVIAAVTAAIVVVAGTVIRIAFGADFVPATRTAEWLVGASGLLAFRRVLIAVLQARGRGGLASVIETVLTPVLVVGIVVASLHDDLVGVALTMGVVGLLSCLALGTAVARTKPLAPSEPLERE